MHTQQEIEQWAKERADDAGRLAKEILRLQGELTLAAACNKGLVRLNEEAAQHRIRMLEAIKRQERAAGMREAAGIAESMCSRAFSRGQTMKPQTVAKALRARAAEIEKGDGK